MIFNILTFLAAFAVAGVAEWFSVMGIVAIYAGAPVFAIIMGVTLGFAKLVTASWLYRNRETATWKLKAPLLYFTIALMVATSIGVFGFLSKAHLEQGANTIDNGPKIEQLASQVDREKGLIADNEKVITQLDATVNSFLGKDQTNRSLTVRRSQAPQRKQLKDDIAASQKTIDDLNSQKFKLESEVRKMQLDVGPIRYIAELIYGVEADASKNVEAAVRMFTLLIVSSLDPLAVVLLIAANHSMMLRKKDEIEEQVAPVASSPEIHEAPSSLTGRILPQTETVREVVNEEIEPVIQEDRSDRGVSQNTRWSDSDATPTPVLESVVEAEHATEDLAPGEPLHGEATESGEILNGNIAQHRGMGSDQESNEEAASIFEKLSPSWEIKESEEVPRDIDTDRNISVEETATVQEAIPPVIIKQPSITSIRLRSEEKESVTSVADAIFKKMVTPIAPIDATLREILGNTPHFIPVKIHEEERTENIRPQESIVPEKTGHDPASLTIPDTIQGKDEVEEVASSTSIQTQDEEVSSTYRNGKASSPSSHKYPKALSWLNEFRSNRNG